MWLRTAVSLSAILWGHAARGAYRSMQEPQTPQQPPPWEQHDERILDWDALFREENSIELKNGYYYLKGLTGYSADSSIVCHLFVQKDVKHCTYLACEEDLAITDSTNAPGKKAYYFYAVAPLHGTNDAGCRSSASSGTLRQDLKGLLGETKMNRLDTIEQGSQEMLWPDLLQ